MSIVPFSLVLKFQLSKKRECPLVLRRSSVSLVHGSGCHFRKWTLVPDLGSIFPVPAGILRSWRLMASVVRSDIIPFLFETFFFMSSSDLKPFFEVDQEVSELWLAPPASLLSSRVINTHVYLDLVYQLSTYLVRSFLSWFFGSLIRVLLFQSATATSNPSVLHQATFINYLGILIQHLVRIEILSGGLLDASVKAPIIALYLASLPERAARLRFLITEVRRFVTASRFSIFLALFFRRRLKLVRSLLRGLYLMSIALYPS